MGWIVAALAYVMLAALLRDAGDPIISTLASVLFLIAIALAVVFWAFHLSPTLLAAEETARTSNVPAYYEILQVSAESSLGVYQLLGLMATAGFGWALLQTGIAAELGWMGYPWMGRALGRSVLEVIRGISITSHGDANCDWYIPAT